MLTRILRALLWPVLYALFLLAMSPWISEGQELPTHPERAWQTPWVASMIVKDAGTLWDAFSSRHVPYEQNSLVAGPSYVQNGLVYRPFAGWTLTAIETGGMDALEYLTIRLLRGHPRIQRTFRWIYIPANGTLGAIHFGGAIHNLNLSAQH